MLRSFLVSGAVVALAASAVAACGSGDVPLGSSSTSQDNETVGSTCKAAGGACLPVGDDPCTTTASSSVDDCNPDRSPAGAFCCLSAGDGGVSADDGGDAGTAPACNWPTSLGSLDAGSSTQCSAARAFLECVGSDGVDEACLSDDFTACPDNSATPGTTFACTNACADDEYAAACGFGPSPAPEPPAGCRSVSNTPAGTEYYCCPCGT